MFYAPGTGTNTKGAAWIKPQGASFVWFTLIGAGSNGDPVTTIAGGGSGAVTNFMCPAFLIPDELRVNVGIGADAGSSSGYTTISYQQKDGTGYELLSARSPAGTNVVAPVMTANYFTCMGIFQSVAGVLGTAAGVTASTTTFLSGGGGSGTVTSNYGYSIPANTNGFFQTQPIIVGVGGSSTVDTTQSGIGCGGSLGVTIGGRGGNGLAVIITW
jgi:hypothetical protein